VPDHLPEELPSYLSARADGCLLRVRVVPRAGRSGLSGVRQDALLVRLAAAPVDGAANDALLALLADVLAVPRRAVTLLSGERSRDKRLLVTGCAADAVARRLATALHR
jgi:uncharacterized protein (TIGR00251 family)